MQRQRRRVFLQLMQQVLRKKKLQLKIPSSSGKQQAHVSMVPRCISKFTLEPVLQEELICFAGMLIESVCLRCKGAVLARMKPAMAQDTATRKGQIGMKPSLPASMRTCGVRQHSIGRICGAQEVPVSTMPVGHKTVVIFTLVFWLWIQCFARQQKR